MRIKEGDKEVMRRLQDEWQATGGTRPSQQELLTQTLGFVARHRKQFLDEAVWRPLTVEESKRWDKVVHDGGSWDPSDIDRIVYEDP